MFQPDSAKPLGGRYQVIQLLGMGGFGQTFLAQDLHLPGHPRCVVKQLKPQVQTSQELQVARRLFDTEAQVLYRLGSHPQIPGLLAHFEENQEFYLAQELIEGLSLEAELANQPPWRDGEAIAYLHDLLSTLAFVHDHQVIHRDIKPSNLIRRSSDHRLVLIDFGAVKQASTRLTTAPSSLNRTISIGTEGYMPGEQLAGRPQFSSDVYAVGIIAIQGLTGRQPHLIPTHPHSGELDWHGLAPHCHPSLVTLLDYMVQYDFRSRYATAAEALAALQETFPQAAGSMATPSRTAAGARALATSPPSSPSRAVPTVAVGRRPHAATGATAAAPSPPEHTRRQKHRAGNQFLPVGLGLAALVGLGLVAWRAFLAPPVVDTGSQANDSFADGAPDPMLRVEALPEPGATASAPPPAAVSGPAADPSPASTTPSPDEELAESADLPPAEAAAPDTTKRLQPDASLTPNTAQTTISSLYSHVSNQSWDAARALFGESLAQQFEPGFFEQFEQVTVDNLRVTHQTADTVELVGRNTYYYPDGSQQQEERTFRVQLVAGEPRIVGSDFVQVLQPRGGD